ncbi:MAG: transporter substrate-binding domain-containing protein [Alphaproteobacteria bacterium]
MSRITALEFEALAKEKVPFAGQMGITVRELGDGTATLKLPFRDDFLRPGGTISGPVMMGLADLAMYAAVLSRIGLVEHTLTVTLNITFLRPPQPADVIAQAKLFKAGKRQRATSFERFMREEMPGIDLRVYATMDEAYLDLQAGRVDAIMADVVAASDGFLKKPGGEGFEMRGPEYTGVKWFGYGAGVGVRKEDAYIADAFSKAIHQMREDGTYQEISNKWFGFDVYGG